jgi:hypothetical protein
VGQFRLRSRANPKAWAIAIANPVARGQVDQSTLLHFGDLRPCMSRLVPHTSACSKRRQQVSGSTAPNAEDI